MKNGKGIYSFINGEKYEGQFKDDKFEGKGIYYYLYEGEYKNNLKQEKGYTTLIMEKNMKENGKIILCM